MKTKLDIAWEFKRWWIRFSVARFHFSRNRKPEKIDVLFYFTYGYGVIASRLQYGFWFFIDALRFNIEEGKYKSPGFEIPLGNYYPRTK